MTSRTMAWLVATAAFACGPALAQQALPRLNIDKSKISVSGLSSGGFMAHQLGVAHSSTFMGVGVFAGGPYMCALACARWPRPWPSSNAAPSPRPCAPPMATSFQAIPGHARQVGVQRDAGAVLDHIHRRHERRLTAVVANVAHGGVAGGGHGSGRVHGVTPCVH